jgi:hypothetical protein
MNPRPSGVIVAASINSVGWAAKASIVVMPAGIITALT